MSDTGAPPGDAASVTVMVAVAPTVAFEVFTREIDAWWRRGPKYRIARRTPGVLTFEPRVGGRLFESFASETGTQILELGRIRVWDPPARLAFDWRVANAAPHVSTLVEVSFEPTAHGTAVTVRHSGWSALPVGHPARHGLEGAAMSRMIGLWWAELMTSLREHTAARTR